MKTCTNCGEVKALDCYRAGHGQCKICSASKRREYVKTNAEKISAAKRAYNVAHAEKNRSAYSAYRKANVEKVKAKDAAYRRANAEKIGARESSYRRANAEKIGARESSYRRANAEKIRFVDSTYRKTNVEKIKDYRAVSREQMTARYVAGSVLRIPMAELTPEHLELKRLQLTIVRGNKLIDKLLTTKQD